MRESSKTKCRYALERTIWLQHLTSTLPCSSLIQTRHKPDSSAKLTKWVLKKKPWDTTPLRLVSRDSASGPTIPPTAILWKRSSIRLLIGTAFASRCWSPRRSRSWCRWRSRPRHGGSTQNCNGPDPGPLGYVAANRDSGCGHQR